MRRREVRWPRPGRTRSGPSGSGGLVALPQLILQLGRDPGGSACSLRGSSGSALDHPDNRIPYAALAARAGLRGREHEDASTSASSPAGRSTLSAPGGSSANPRQELSHGRPCARGIDRSPAPEQRRRTRVPPQARGITPIWAMRRITGSGPGRCTSCTTRRWRPRMNIMTRTLRAGLEAVRGVPAARQTARRRPAPRVLQGRAALRRRVQRPAHFRRGTSRAGFPAPIRRPIAAREQAARAAGRAGLPAAGLPRAAALDAGQPALWRRPRPDARHRIAGPSTAA